MNESDQTNKRPGSWEAPMGERKPNHLRGNDNRPAVERSGGNPSYKLGFFSKLNNVLGGLTGIEFVYEPPGQTNQGVGHQAEKQNSRPKPKAVGWRDQELKAPRIDRDQVVGGVFGTIGMAASGIARTSEGRPTTPENAFVRSNDVIFATQMADGGVCLLVADPVSSNPDASNMIAKRFALAFKTDIERLSAPPTSEDLDRAFNTGYVLAGGTSSVESDDGNSAGYCTVFMVEISPQLEARFTARGDGCMYIQGYGFIPNNSLNTIEQFGSFNQDGAFIPYQVGRKQSNTPARFSIDLKRLGIDLSNRKIAFGSDCLTKLARVKGGQLPNAFETSDVIEDMLVSDNPEEALVRLITTANNGIGIDDAAVACFKVPRQR